MAMSAVMAILSVGGDHERTLVTYILDHSCSILVVVLYTDTCSDPYIDIHMHKIHMYALLEKHLPVLPYQSPDTFGCAQAVTPFQPLPRKH